MSAVLQVAMTGSLYRCLMPFYKVKSAVVSILHFEKEHDFNATYNSRWYDLWFSTDQHLKY